MSSVNGTIHEHVDKVWADDILPSLHDYIRIPCVSQAFDPDWKVHGHQDAATELIRAWCAARGWSRSTRLRGPARCACWTAC